MMKHVLKGLMASFAITISVAAHSASVVTLSPASGHPGTVVSVSGTGFGASEAVDVYVDTVDTKLLVSSSSGAFASSVTIPASAGPGGHYITAIGRVSGDAAQASFNDTTNWFESGFGAGHLGWNRYENTLTASVLPTTGLLWSKSVGGVFRSSPVVVAGQLYIGTYGGSGSGVYSLNAASGATTWQATLSGATFYASPAYYNATIYILSYGGVMYALNASTGAVKWQTALANYGEGDPIVVNGVVYVASGDSFYALNASTGALIWTTNFSNSVNLTPAVVNGIVYIGCNDKKAYALKASTGSIIWTYTMGDVPSLAPAVANGIAYFGSYDKNIYALNASTGGLKWTYTAGDSVESSIALANNMVYAAAGSYVYGLNAATGGLYWQSSISNFASSTVTVAGGVVYVPDSSGGINAYDASYGSALALWTSGAYVGGGVSISNGVAYFGSEDGYVYAYAQGAGFDAVQARKPQVRPAPSSLKPDYTLQISQ